LGEIKGAWLSRGYANFPVGLIGALMRTSKINQVQRKKILKNNISFGF